MKTVMVAGLVGVLAFGFAGVAWGEAASGGAGEGNSATATTPAATPARESRLDRAVASAKTQVAVAEKILKQYDEEMAKPDGKKDLRRAQALKLSAAQTYLRAAQRAKGDAILIAKADEKELFLDQYEKPNREKAISLLLELAAAAREAKDLRGAAALYAQVLRIDPKDATAEAALKALEVEMKTAKGAAAGSTGGSVDKKDIKDYQKGYKTDYSGTHTDWARYGRPSYW